MDEEFNKKMKEHREIKWTEILRIAISDYLSKIEKPSVIYIKELRN